MAPSPDYWGVRLWVAPVSIGSGEWRDRGTVLGVGGGWEPDWDRVFCCFGRVWAGYGSTLNHTSQNPAREERTRRANSDLFLLNSSNWFHAT